MRRLLLAPVVIPVALALVACHSPAPVLADSAAAQGGTATLPTRDRLIVTTKDECPTRGGPQATAVGPILAVLAPAILETGIGMLGSALIKASGRDNSVQLLTGAAAVDAFYRRPAAGSPDGYGGFGCVIVTLGEPAAAPTTAAEGERLDRTRLASGSKIYVESRVVPSPDRTSFRLVPVYVRYAAFLEPRNDRLKDVELRFEFREPGAADAFASGALLLNGIPTNTVLDNEKSISASTPWMKPRPLSEAESALLKELSGLEAVKAPGSTDSARLRELKRRLAAYGPTNLNVTIVETRDYNKLLAAVGDILAQKKGDLARAAAIELLPKTPEQKKADEIASLESFRQLAAATAAVEAKAVELAELKSKGAPQAAIRTAETELVQLQYAANIKAVAAGMQPPYTIGR